MRENVSRQELAGHTPGSGVLSIMTFSFLFCLREYLSDRLDELVNGRFIPSHPDGKKGSTYYDLRDETNFSSDLTE